MRIRLVSKDGVEHVLHWWPALIVIEPNGTPNYPERGPTTRIVFSRGALEIKDDGSTPAMEITSEHGGQLTVKGATLVEPRA